MALGGHAVEHLSHRQGADRCRQAVTGEIAEQHTHVAGRGKCRQHQVAIEQRVRRLQVANVGRRKASRVGHFVEYRLGHPLLVKQMMVMPCDLIALRQHGSLQPAQTVHGANLGSEDNRAVGLGHEIIAPRLKATHQAFFFIQRRQENDRHQRFASQCLDLPRRLEAIHDRHQGVQQHQLRAPLDEQRYRLLAVLCGEYLMTLAAHDLRKQKAIDSTVFGDQHGQRLFGRHVGAQLLISKSFSKLEMARILRTSELACTTRTSDSSPPAWSRSNSSMPSAELSR